MRDFFKKQLQLFFLITTCTLFSSALFITIFEHGMKITSEFLWQILIFSLLGTLSMFILYSEKALSRIEANIRKILHYIAINVLLIGLGLYWGWFSTEHKFQIFVIIINVAVVYAVIEVLLYFINARQAEKLNEKIKEYKSHRNISDRN